MENDSSDSENMPSSPVQNVGSPRSPSGQKSEQRNRTVLPPQHLSFNVDDYYEVLPETIAAEAAAPAHEILISNPKVQKGWSDEVESTNPGTSGSYYDSPNKRKEVEEEESNKYTKRQYLIFLVYSFTEFCTGAIISLQAPFYPAEAEKKGLSASEYGIVFGIFEFTVFLVSFVYGRYMSYVGPKFVFNLGLFVEGVCCVLFGLLDRVDGHTLFYALSMVTRIVEALAGAACLNAAFTIIALEFPKSVATTFATMETLFAVGLTSGPIIGGALFDIGGFSLPFFACGGMLILVSIFTFLVLPTPIDTNAGDKNSKGLIQLLQIPEVAICAAVIFSAALSIGHLASTLEPHIRMFDLSSVAVGVIIVISGGTYAILAPLWGRLCDRLPRLDLYMLIGCCFIIIGYLLIGPAPFMPFDTILWVTCLGLVLQGIGLGGTLVSSFIQCLISASAHGFPDNVSTYSMVSGIWASLFALGNFLGPTISGVLYDAVGFRNGTLFVVGLQAIVAILILCMLIFGKKSKSGDRRRLSEFTESDPLLPDTKS